MLKHYAEQAIEAVSKALLIVICAGALCCTAVFFAGYSAFLFLGTLLPASLAAAATTVTLLLIFYLIVKLSLRSKVSGSSKKSSIGSSASTEANTDRSTEEQLVLSLFAGFNADKDPEKSLALLISTMQQRENAR